MSERQLARVVKIDQVIKHPNADSLDLCKIGGWQVVAKLGEFKEGELAIYFEIDSFIPTTIAPFLVKGSEPSEYNGVKGERLRTIKLRKELSQGLLLPLSILNNVPSSYGFAFGIPEGEDLTEVLGIQKWERPLSANMQGMSKGNFPSFLRKTDQDRIQNLKFDCYQDLICEVTEKLDGSSMTIYFNEGVAGVCSRNVDLKLDQEGNAFVNMFNTLKESGFIDQCLASDRNFAIQGELLGYNIQGNKYGLQEGEYQFYVFSMFDIDKQSYVEPEKVQEFCKLAELNYVPVLDNVTIEGTIEDYLKMAEDISALYKVEREGLVFKSLDGLTSFKVISNKWILENDG